MQKGARSVGAKRWESGRNLEVSAREYTFGLAPNGWLAFSAEGIGLLCRQKGYVQEHPVMR